MRCTIPSRDQVDPETPLRLNVAAVLAFPDGTMTASGLRREAARGRLMVERIAGKDYTTLANIERMRAPSEVMTLSRPGILSARSGEAASCAIRRDLERDGLAARRGQKDAPVGGECASPSPAPPACRRAP